MVDRATLPYVVATLACLLIGHAVGIAFIGIFRELNHLRFRIAINDFLLFIGEAQIKYNNLFHDIAREAKNMLNHGSTGSKIFTDVIKSCSYNISIHLVPLARNDFVCIFPWVFSVWPHN